MTPDQLREKIDRSFVTCVGPAMAYFQLTREERAIYSRIQVCIAGEPEQVGHILCDWVWARIRALLTKAEIEDADVRGTWFWRTHPTLTEFVDEEGRACTSLHLRFALPARPDIMEGLPIKEGESALWL